MAGYLQEPDGKGSNTRLLQTVSLVVAVLLTGYVTYATVGLIQVNVEQAMQLPTMFLPHIALFMVGGFAPNAVKKMIETKFLDKGGKA